MQCIIRKNNRNCFLSLFFFLSRRSHISGHSGWHFWLGTRTFRPPVPVIFSFISFCCWFLFFFSMTHYFCKHLQNIRQKVTYVNLKRLDAVVQQNDVAQHFGVLPVTCQLRCPDIVGSASRQPEAWAHYAPARVCDTKKTHSSECVRTLKSPFFKSSQDNI